MGVVIDTSALIALERVGAGFDPQSLAGTDEPAVIPAIVYAELQAGVRLARGVSRTSRRRARIEALTFRVPVVEFDQTIADRWADLFAGLTRAGTMIPSNDLQVAATATHLDFAILVGPKGEQHFTKVPGVRLLRLRA